MIYRTLALACAVSLTGCETITTNPETGEVTVTRPSSELGLLISTVCNLFLDQSAILSIIGANLGETNQEQADAVCAIFREQQAETIQAASRATEVSITLPNGNIVEGQYDPATVAQ